MRRHTIHPAANEAPRPSRLTARKFNLIRRPHNPVPSIRRNVRSGEPPRVSQVARLESDPSLEAPTQEKRTREAPYCAGVDKICSETKEILALDGGVRDFRRAPRHGPALLDDARRGADRTRPGAGRRGRSAEENARRRGRRLIALYVSARGSTRASTARPTLHTPTETDRNYNAGVEL